MFASKKKERKKEKVQRKQLCDVRLSAPKSLRWQCECSAQCTDAAVRGTCKHGSVIGGF